MPVRLDSLRRQLDAKAARVETAFRNRTDDELRTTVPVDTGQLKQSQNVTSQRTRQSVRWTITADAPHAEAQAFGARPHVIRAKNAPYLRFYWPKVGRVVYFRKVNHPGNPANPWWTNVIEGSKDRLERLWRSL